MRSLFKRAGRVAAGVSLVVILAAHGAAAHPRQGVDGRFGQQIQRAKRFVFTILHRIGWPPGDQEPTSGGGS